MPAERSAQPVGGRTEGALHQFPHRAGFLGKALETAKLAAAVAAPGIGASLASVGRSAGSDLRYEYKLAVQPETLCGRCNFVLVFGVHDDKDVRPVVAQEGRVDDILSRSRHETAPLARVDRKGTRV